MSNPAETGPSPELIAEVEDALTPIQEEIMADVDKAMLGRVNYELNLAAPAPEPNVPDRLKLEKKPMTIGEEAEDFLQRRDASLNLARRYTEFMEGIQRAPQPRDTVTKTRREELLPAKISWVMDEPTTKEEH
jgi:hypothetical protein